ncbi:MAG: SPASM domain-containing protein, partial [bacterium]
KIRLLYNKKGIKTDAGLLPDNPIIYPRKGICNYPWLGSVFINVKGEITPCCALPEKGLENVFDVGLDQAWNGKIRNFRKSILNGNYPVECCNQCGYCMDADYKRIKQNAEN